VRIIYNLVSEVPFVASTRLFLILWQDNFVLLICFVEFDTGLRLSCDKAILSLSQKYQILRGICDRGMRGNGEGNSSPLCSPAQERLRRIFYIIRYIGREVWRHNIRALLYWVVFIGRPCVFVLILYSEHWVCLMTFYHMHTLYTASLDGFKRRVRPDVAGRETCVL
jgi:hypothetical protein